MMMIKGKNKGAGQILFLGKRVVVIRLRYEAGIVGDGSLRGRDGMGGIIILAEGGLVVCPARMVVDMPCCCCWWWWWWFSRVVRVVVVQHALLPASQDGIRSVTLVQVPSGGGGWRRISSRQGGLVDPGLVARALIQTAAAAAGKKGSSSVLMIMIITITNVTVIVSEVTIRTAVGCVGNQSLHVLQSLLTHYRFCCHVLSVVFFCVDVHCLYCAFFYECLMLVCSVSGKKVCELSSLK